MPSVLPRDLCPILQGFVTFRPRVQVSSDSLCSMFQYRLTCPLLSCISVALASFQLFGSPIRCHVSGSSIDSKFVEEFCWARSTYSLNVGGGSGSGSYPGLGMDHHTEPTFHSYYQFVPLFLMLLAGLCLLPRLVWRYYEGGLVSLLVPEDSQGVSVNTLDWEEVHQYCRRAAANFTRNINTGFHTQYGVTYLLVELFCLVNIVVQVTLLQVFLGWFVEYLPSLFHYMITDHQDMTSPEEILFPLLTKCTMRKFGPSGSEQQQDALCLLTVNLLNQKVFLVLWMWLAFTMAVSSLLFLHRLLCLMFRPLRLRRLGQVSDWRLDQSILNSLEKNLMFGDWIVLTLVAGHFTPDVAGLLLQTVEEELQTIVKTKFQQPDSLVMVSNQTCDSNILIK